MLSGNGKRWKAKIYINIKISQVVCELITCVVAVDPAAAELDMFNCSDVRRI